MLKQPLNFDKGDVAWWFRGPANLQIELFEHVEGHHFQMNIDELNIRRIAAINRQDLYYLKYVYVETNADQPTGLYPERADNAARRIDTVGYDYEEYGLVDGRLPVSRAEYDDGAAVIDGRPVEILGRVVLRIRHTAPYNFLIAPNGSPINNASFDDELVALLNPMLRGDEVFESMCDAI